MDVSDKIGVILISYSEGRRNFYPPNNFIDNIRYKKYYKKNVAPLMYPFEGNELAGSHNNGASYYFVETI